MTRREVQNDPAVSEPDLIPQMTGPKNAMWQRLATSARILAPAGLFGFVAAACAEDKPLNTFEAEGPDADRILSFSWILWAIMALVFVLVVIGGVVLSIKQRVDPDTLDPEDLPEQTHGNTRLEWGWTAVPALLLAVLSYPSVGLIMELEGQNDPVDGVDVMVIGRQWWWEYRYDIDGDGFFDDADGDGEIWGRDGDGGDGPGGAEGDNDDREWPLQMALDDDDLSVPNELVIPAGQQIDLTITSGDVIHSYWIPRLNGKRDAVPGRFTTWRIESYDPGKFTGWCTEFCGLSHARMRMSVIALPEAEFEAWLAHQQEPADNAEDSGNEEAAAGQALFLANCASCHVVDSDAHTYADDFDPGDEVLKAGAAPNLTHFASRSVFAGAIYAQYLTDGTGQPYDPNSNEFDESSYLDLAENGRFNVPQIRRWIRDASSQKDMDADDQRGMPAFPGLTETDLDNLVAYLATLD